MTNDRPDGISRRAVLGAGAAAGLMAASTGDAAAAASAGPDWEAIRAQFLIHPGTLNLNNAAVSPQPKSVLQRMEITTREMATLPPLTIAALADKRAVLRNRLAALIDADPQCIVLNRNATEGLCTAIYGIDLKPGDEVVASVWDYKSMLNAWKQREQRDGIKLVLVDFPLPANDETIVQAYAEKITPKTRVIHMTHIPEYNGQVFPVGRLSALARQARAWSIVDAAHSVAHIPVNFREIGCDVLAASLHKWLCGPIGSGMLSIREERQDQLWPMMAPYSPATVPINRFDDAIGTYDYGRENALVAALDFRESIGGPAIVQRLHHLTAYWVDKARLSVPGFRMRTPLEPERSGAIATFEVAGLPGFPMRQALLDRHGILVRTQNHNGINGVRISPHLYTREAELDRFVLALSSVVRQLQT